MSRWWYGLPDWAALLVCFGWVPVVAVVIILAGMHDCRRAEYEDHRGHACRKLEGVYVYGHCLKGVTEVEP